MDIVYILIGAAVILLLFVIIYKLFAAGSDPAKEMMRRLADQISENNSTLRQEVGQNVQISVKNLGEMLGANQKASQDAQSARIDDMNKSLTYQLRILEQRFASLEQNNELKLDAMRKTMSDQLVNIREDNNRKLDSIRQTVDEKLENKMNESFRLVSERLEQVYKGLGEMQSIASGVGDLKKVLSNVKTRGILGEIQLGAILAEILAPDQYDTDIAVIPRSQNRVEFAVKLPGGDGESTVYLPIDSKFPGDTFAALQDAYDLGDPDAVASAKKTLAEVIRKCAKDIREKYISPPYTTNFGIMFLPFEGLYAEVVNSGLVEQLQNDYNVNVAGPSTMAALLNSLQMGFRTLAIQKRSNEVWELLGAVKTEFGTFAKALEETQKHIRKVDDDLENLVGVRTRMMNRKLSKIEAVPEAVDTSKLLDSSFD
ncbi:MAG: DNA recombination protein RmuC [Ruminococcus sp.]|nr:DNA recombination protein RmuC [Ruminococcus sp.]